MAAHKSTEGSRFAVDLGDLKLPDLVEKRVAAEIQTAVLRGVAETDLGGRTRFRLEDLIDRFPDGTLGLIFNPEGGSPPWIPPLMPRDTLTVEDHTRILREIMEHPFEVIQYMPKKERTSNPSLTAVLEAALQVEQIDSDTKDRIRMVLDILPRVEEARADAPADLQRSLADLERQLARRPIDEQIRTLRGRRSDYRDQDGLAEAMEVAAQILEDGRSSIYSPEFSFHRTLREGKRGKAVRRPVDDISAADTIGATAGGGVGAVVGGVGAAPGAVAGGVGASAGAAIGHLILWIFD